MYAFFDVGVVCAYAVVSALGEVLKQISDVERTTFLMKLNAATYPKLNLRLYHSNKFQLCFEITHKSVSFLFCKPGFNRELCVNKKWYWCEPTVLKCSAQFHWVFYRVRIEMYDLDPTTS